MLGQISQSAQQQRFGNNGEEVVPAKSIQAPANHVWARDTRLLNRILGVTVAFLFIPIAVLLAYTDFGLLLYAVSLMVGWFVVGVLVCVLASIFIRRVEWAVFNYNSGTPAVAIGCTPGDDGSFQRFISALESVVATD